jgi:hypothetical protein
VISVGRPRREPLQVRSDPKIIVPAFVEVTLRGHAVVRDQGY